MRTGWCGGCRSGGGRRGRERSWSVSARLAGWIGGEELRGYRSFTRRLLIGCMIALYSQYFENEKHPSAPETLLKAATDAGIPENEAKKFVEDEDEGLADVRMAIREQQSNGVDAVPYVVIEGKRRDFTLQGAKEVEEYIKMFNQVIKEA